MSTRTTTTRSSRLALGLAGMLVVGSTIGVAREQIDAGRASLTAVESHLDSSVHDIDWP